MKWIGKLLSSLLGKWEECKPGDYITIDGHVRGNPPPKAVCTCGWSFGPNRLNIVTLEAKEHTRSTGHELENSLYYNETEPKKIIRKKSKTIITNVTETTETSD